MITHEGNDYSFWYDHMYSIGRFIRKEDGAVTHLEVGSDCQDVRRQLNRLALRTNAKNYPLQAPSFQNMFDSMASEYTFHADEA